MYCKCYDKTSSVVMYSFKNYTDFKELLTFYCIIYLFYFNILNIERNHGLMGNICGFLLLRRSLALLQQSSQLSALN